MEFRTDEDLVKGTLQADYDYDNNPSLVPAMRKGNLLTNRLVLCASRKNINIDSDTLIEIETELSAHFYCTSDRLAAREKTDDANIVYQGVTDKGLNYTPYGQNAMLLDPSGCLNSFNSPRKVSIDWLGKDPSQKIDWIDRQ